MQVIDPGHAYALDELDGPEKSILTFVKREGEGYPGNRGHHAGTNIQEVLRALIDRVKYLDQQIPSHHNALILLHLREALFSLEMRAAGRHKRSKSFRVDVDRIETYPTCLTCGHIGCPGSCH